MQIEMWKTGKVKPYKNNPRTPGRAVDAVAESITRFGFRQPIVVDPKGVIIVGHTRWLAARELHLPEVPVHVARDLPAKEARAYRVADNKTGEVADWNTEKLVRELTGLREDGVDLEALGFTVDELQQVLKPTASMGRTDRDEIPQREKKTRSKPGDLWRLGDHRLLVGSSLDPDSVSRATGGRMPLAITDPPFELNAYDQAKALRLAGVKTAVVLGGGKEVWALAAMEDFGIRFDFVIVYDRSVALSGKSSLIYRHNRVLLMDYDPADKKSPPGFSSGAVLGRGVPFDRDKWASITGTKCSVLQAPVQKSLYGYGEICDIFRSFVRALHSPTVYDPFAGSGTGMITSEIEGKKWIGVELEPWVADIAVKRWEAFTGRKAVRK